MATLNANAQPLGSRSLRGCAIGPSFLVGGTRRPHSMPHRRTFGVDTTRPEHGHRWQDRG
jgi:hypothetical protein